MPNFFCFNNMNYQFQPEGSNWCWAACLSNMIIGLKADSSIGNSQCNLVSHYRSFLNGLNSNEENKLCCSESILDQCNLRLDDDHLKYMFEKSGFLITPYDTISELNSFEFIVDKLNENQAPLILKTRVNGSAHMVLINGYGTKTSGCNYLLISNPDNSYKELYYSHEYYITNNTIEKFWTASVENQDNLGKDKLLDFNYNFVKKTLDFNIKESSSDSEILNPWNYLNDFNSPFFINLMKGGNNNLNVDNYTIIKEEFENCKVHQNRYLVNVGSIKFLKEEELSNIDENEGFVGFTYFKNYAIHAKISYENKNIHIIPILFPKNYRLTKKELPLSEFLDELNKLKEQKVSSFLN